MVGKGAQSRHIIFAESEQRLERSISLMLKSNNFAVTVVQDCLEAFEVLQELTKKNEPPALLIIDFGRQRKTGERFAAKLREWPGAVPVILITEYGDEGLVGKNLSTVGSLMLTKPFDPDELMDAVCQLLNS